MYQSCGVGAWRGAPLNLCDDRSRLSRRLISPRVVRRMRLRRVGEVRSSPRWLCFVCWGFGGGVTYLLSTAGLRRRAGCLLCSRTGLRVCCSKPLARRSRIVATSNPRMQRESTARIQSTQLALVGETAPHAMPCRLCLLARPRPPRAAHNHSRNKLAIHNITRSRGSAHWS